MATDAQSCGIFDCTRIRVVIIDPYNQEIREAKIARGVFALDAADGGCLRFFGKVTRTNELHIYDGKGPPCFLVREENIFLGLGFVTGGRDAQRRPRSARISVAEVSSFVRFPDTFARDL
jgi:hypothetical protein